MPGPIVEVTETSLPTRSRRNSRSLRTRQALVDSAAVLFAKKGYVETTVQDISDLAGVTERTFFLHFPTKADVLFSIRQEDLDALTICVAEQPEDLDGLAVIESAYTQWGRRARSFPGVVSGHVMIQQILAAAEQSSALRGREVDYHRAMVAAVAEGLRRRASMARSSDIEIEMMAAVAMRVVHQALIEWSSSDPASLGRIMRKYFRVYRKLTERIAARRP